MKTKQILGGVLTGAVLFTSTLAALGQGALIPPGGPAPSMRTLDQIYDKIGAGGGDARTDVLTLPPDANALHAITQPGSYYLTTNILGLSGGFICGIAIEADNVTLDLNGFALLGNGDNYSGIWVWGMRTNITIVNGTVSDWGNANIWADMGAQLRVERVRMNGSKSMYYAGLYAPYTEQCVVKDCQAQGNLGRGYYCGAGALLSSCQAAGNGGGGFWLGPGASLQDCQASANTTAGFVVGGAATLKTCQALANTGRGFSVNDGGLLDGCLAATNGEQGLVFSDRCTAANCIVRNNGNVGIYGGSKSIITGCRVEDNGGAGIALSTGNVIKDCTSENNMGAGIAVTAWNVIKDCTLRNNMGAGIDAMDNCQILACTASGNTSGIYPFHNCLIKDCIVTANSYTGITGVESGSSVINCAVENNGADGISTYSGVAIIGCTVTGNTNIGIDAASKVNITGCTAVGNGNAGISVTDDAVISECNACTNGAKGIQVANQCVVERNLCNGNASYGIYVDGWFNRIDGNTTYANQTGIVVESGANRYGNLVVRNTARNRNVASYGFSVPANNTWGPYITLGGGQINLGTGGNVSATGWENFQYYVPGLAETK